MRTSIVLLLAILLSGCGLMSPVAPTPMATYSIAGLNAHYRSSGRASMSTKTLLLNTVVADPGYDSEKMIYVNVPFKLKAYANNAWVAPPATMLMPLLAQNLRNTRYFRAVVTPPFPGVANYILSARLLVMQQEFLQPESQERMAIAMTLISTATNQVVGDRVFQITVPAPQNNPYSGVLAANKAASILCGQITRYVVRLAR